MSREEESFAAFPLAGTRRGETMPADLPPRARARAKAVSLAVRSSCPASIESLDHWSSKFKMWAR
jgi:hypothetical protein